MNNQSGPGRRGDDKQGQNREDDELEQRRSAGGQGGQSGKDAGPVLPEGEKVGEWSDDESEKKE